MNEPTTVLTRATAMSKAMNFLSANPELWKGFPVDLSKVELIEQSFSAMASHDGLGFVALMSDEKLNHPEVAKAMGVDLSKLLTFANRSPALLLGRLFVDGKTGDVKLI